MIDIKDIEKFNNTLKEKSLTIVCAESITAGLLSSTIASIEGASSILKGSIVTYSQELKCSILKIDPRIIDKNTAESMETTVEMVYGLINLYPSSDLYVAVTGIASPGTDEYPINGEVGDVYIAIYYKKAESNKRLTKFEINIKVSETNKSRNEIRNEIRNKTVLKIFDTILGVINSK